MRVERDNVYARVVGWDDDREHTWLTRVLTYGRRTGAFTSPTKSYDELNDRFLAGLLPDVMKAAQGDSVTMQVRDVRGPAPAIATDVDLGWLDDHQRAALGAVCTYLRGIVKVPTGGGKTEVFIAAALLFSGGRVAVFAPREQLATQAADRWALRTDGAPCGVFGGGRHDLHRRVTFATFQAVAKAIDAGDARVIAWLESLHLIAADECHTLAATTFLPVLTRCTNARVRIGFSATPLDRTDERAVHTLGALGPIIYELPAEALVQSGRIVPATVQVLRVSQVWTAPRYADTSKPCPGCGALDDDPCDRTCWTLGGEARFAAVYDDLIVNGAARNAALVQAVLTAPKPALIFVRKLKQATNLRDLLHKATGNPIPIVDGKVRGPMRTSVAARIDRGDYPVSIATAVWEAGVDIPSLRTVVNAGAGASIIRTVQVLGRAVRGAEGKTGCTVIDVVDDDPTLHRHARKRLKTYRDEGWTVIDPGATPAPGQIEAAPVDFFDDTPGELFGPS